MHSCVDDDLRMIKKLHTSLQIKKKKLKGNEIKAKYALKLFAILSYARRLKSGHTQTMLTHKNSPRNI